MLGSHLTTYTENLGAASSKISDIDVADEVAKMVSHQILQQSSTAMLTQANSQFGVALALLNNGLN